MMNTRHIIAALLLALIVACGAPQPEVSDSAVQTAVAGTIEAGAVAVQPAATEPAEPSPTRAPTGTPRPTNTPRPTRTPAPTPTATETPRTVEELGPDLVFSANWLDSQTRGDVEVEVARVLVSDLAAAGEVFDSGFLDEEWEGFRSVVMLVFRVTNHGEEVMRVNPTSGTVLVGTEQVDLGEWRWMLGFGDDVSGEILPGAQKIGGLWFGLRRTVVTDAERMTLSIDPPYGDDYMDRGDRYFFELELTPRAWVPLPDELR